MDFTFKKFSAHLINHMLNTSRDISGRSAWRESLLQRQASAGPNYKRRPYFKHMDHLPDLEYVFDGPTQPLTRGAMTDLASLTNVPYTTLWILRSNLLVDLNWPPIQASRATCRICSEEEEAQIVSDIVNRFLDKHLYYSDDDFAVHAATFYNRISEEKFEA
jgi:hypothetical protein